MPFCFIFFFVLLCRLPYIKFFSLEFCSVLFCFSSLPSICESVQCIFFSLSPDCSYLQMMYFMREFLFIFLSLSLSVLFIVSYVCMCYCRNGYTILLSMECCGDVFLFVHIRSLAASNFPGAISLSINFPFSCK